MACEGLVDWKGKPINTKVHGGVRAAWYLYCKFFFLFACMRLRRQIKWSRSSLIGFCVCVCLIDYSQRIIR